MPWKMDGDLISVSNGNPIWNYPEGDREVEPDKLHKIQGELKTRLDSELMIRSSVAKSFGLKEDHKSEELTDAISEILLDNGKYTKLSSDFDKLKLEKDIPAPKDQEAFDTAVRTAVDVAKGELSLEYSDKLNTSSDERDSYKLKFDALSTEFDADKRTRAFESYYGKIEGSISGQGADAMFAQKASESRPDGTFWKPTGFFDDKGLETIALHSSDGTPYESLDGKPIPIFGSFVSGLRTTSKILFGGIKDTTRITSETPDDTSAPSASYASLRSDRDNLDLSTPN